MNKKIISLLLAAMMVFISAANVFGATATIGKGTANIVTIPMNASIGAAVTLGRGSINKDADAKDHIAAGTKLGGTVIAAVNGAFFDAYSNKSTESFPNNCARTYGLVVSNGQSIKGAGSAVPTLAFTDTGKALIDMAKPDVTLELRGNQSVAMHGVNDYKPNDSYYIALITPECGFPITLAAGAVVVHVKDNIISKIDTGLASVTCAANEKLVIYNSASWTSAQKWNTFPEPGNSAFIKTALIPDRTANQADWDRVTTAVGAGPWLLQNGVDVFDRNGAMEAKMGKTYNAQRTFAAVKADGTLMIGEVSGTFADIINYLKAQGYIDAVALDGGASSMLYSGESYLQSAGRKLSNVLHIINYGSAAAVPKKPVQADIVSQSPWFAAEGYYEKAQANGLVPSDFDMAAKQNITRAEFCQLAYNYAEKILGSAEITARLNASGITYDAAAAAFSDINNSYKTVIIQSYRLGLVSGKGGGKFDPNGSITRQEAAKLLTNMANVLGIQATGEGKVFDDAASIASWAVDSVDFVVRAGIMSGTGTGFTPLGYFTKEQSITTFVRLFDRQAE